MKTDWWPKKRIASFRKRSWREDIRASFTEEEFRNYVMGTPVPTSADIEILVDPALPKHAFKIQYPEAIKYAEADAEITEHLLRLTARKRK